MVERLYAMTKLGAGDWLLPGNDGQTLWRIRSYDEDGSAVRGDGTPVIGTFWAVYRFRYPLERLSSEPDVWESESAWIECEFGHRRRADAITAALAAETKES
jgi:hypothetical protein